MLYIPYPFKRCTKCGGEFLPTAQHFYKRKTKDGDHPMLDSRCKTCAKKQVRNRYARNPEPIKEYERRYAAENPQKLSERKRDYYQKNKLRLIECSRQARLRNPEINRRAKRKYSRTDKGRWTIRVGKHNRRAAEGRSTREEIERQYIKQQQRCFWCSEYIEGSYHIDHIIPVTRFGTNWIANLVISCHSCNESKCDKLPFQEWQPPHCLGR